MLGTLDFKSLDILGAQLLFLEHSLGTYEGKGIIHKNRKLHLVNGNFPKTCSQMQGENMEFCFGINHMNYEMTQENILQLSQILWNINHNLVVHIPWNWSTAKQKQLGITMQQTSVKNILLYTQQNILFLIGQWRMHK